MICCQAEHSLPLHGGFRVNALAKMLQTSFARVVEKVETAPMTLLMIDSILLCIFSPGPECWPQLRNSSVT